MKAGKINESQHCYPETMYGCNKLYCEHLGRYYTLYYKKGLIDIRSFRCPGLISAHTVPTGGTTEFPFEYSMKPFSIGLIKSKPFKAKSISSLL